MPDQDRQIVDDFVELLNDQGRPIAEYLAELLAKDENAEANEWVLVTL